MPDPLAETRQTYDAIAAEYARQKPPPGARLLADMDALAARLGPGGVVADVGCGPGRETELLRARGLHVVGLDLSMGQLRAAGVAGLAQADMRRLPLRTGSVGALWCLAALLHVPHDAVPPVLGEFRRALRPGGELYLAVAEGDGQDWEAAGRYGSSRRRWYAWHRQDGLTALLGVAGFEVVTVLRTRSSRNWLHLRARRAG